jgi:hypothetical protein
MKLLTHELIYEEAWSSADIGVPIQKLEKIEEKA